jgi:hypothetical protein
MVPLPESPKDCKSGNRWLKFFRKWHRWPGVIMAFFFILWAISGIVMNHRQLISGLDISRNVLPKENRYVNWNNAAVKSAVGIGRDSVVIYGNIGAWLADSALTEFSDFNSGFPKGIDNRKISSMIFTKKGNLYAGTLFGLFFYDFTVGRWEKLRLPVNDARIQWLEHEEEDLLILTRSELLRAKDDPKDFRPQGLHLPPPEGYDNKEGLFRTIWVIHSGEIYGMAGKLIVDALGLIVILLAITGALHFSMPYALRWLKKRKKSPDGAVRTKRFSVKWHKKAGIWITLFILINTVTGMFLRPPLLITIVNARVGKIPWSVLDTPNPWEDKLRAVIYDPDLEGYMIGTTEGLFFADERLKEQMFAPPGQPPLSVMGINVFQKTAPGTYLIGSFNGLYDWQPLKGFSKNHLTGETPGRIDTGSKPFGDRMVSGYWMMDDGKEVVFDYNHGAAIPGETQGIAPMPPEMVEKSPVSWWNFALEVHTGRIFKVLIGDFYILIIPLMGIFGTILIISGLVVWIKLYVRKNR